MRCHCHQFMLSSAFNRWTWTGVCSQRPACGTGLQETVSGVFFERKKIGSRTPDHVQAIGVRLYVRHLFHPKVGACVPQEYRLHLASSRRKGTGLFFVCPVPEWQSKGCGRGLVLPVCKTACWTGRNGIWGSVHRRHKDWEHGEPVYLCLENRCRKESCQAKRKSKGSFQRVWWKRQSYPKEAARVSGQAASSKCRICSRDRKAQERMAKAVWKAGQPVDEVDRVRGQAVRYWK